MRPLFALLLLGCAHGQKAPEGFALSKSQAAEVCLPLGEKAWLGKLLCADGSRPRLTRQGNVGSRNPPLDPNDPRLLLQMDAEVPIRPGEPDLHIIEAVAAECGPSLKYTIYIDMYHCPGTDQPPADHFQF
jgi:hypothetical protein